MKQIILQELGSSPASRRIWQWIPVEYTAHPTDTSRQLTTTPCNIVHSPAP